MKTILIQIAILILMLILYSSKAINDGEEIYQQNCVSCHGENGKKGFLGAGKLGKSTKTVEQQINYVTNGGTIMPKFKNKLSQEEIKQVVKYIQKFRDDK